VKKKTAEEEEDENDVKEKKWPYDENRKRS
jgi:hypothetical protein